MTSQHLTSEENARFNSYFRKLIYQEATSNEMISAFESIPNIQQKLVEKDILQRRKHPNLTHKEQMQINAHRYTEVFRLAKQSTNPEMVFRNPDWFVQLYGFSLNTQAFLATIELLGHQEQVKFWRDLVLKGKVIGGYGQTQLGHGSNVQMLETEAVFDEERGSFVLNSPKNTSTKYWPGCFGLFSTHCVLQANTVVKGKNIGIQTFILPMRDQNLNTLVGIESGDIGPKIGFIKVDNGYLKINNVEIPRENMLSKYVQVQSDGAVLGLENKQAIKYGYGSMLNLRIKLVMGFALAYIYAPAVIQFEICQKTGQINDPFIKKKLIETLCIGIGTVLSNSYISRIFKNYMSALENKDFNKADKLLISCHIISSTFKALSSWKSQETLRESVTLNQFGSFQSTYLPKYLADCVPSVTYEGDNTVLLQQTGKFILMKEKQDELVKPNIEVNSNDLGQLLAVFKFVTSSEIRSLKGLIQKSVEGGNDFKVVWNELLQSQILEVSKIWGRMTFLTSAMQTLKVITQYKSFFQKIVKVFAFTLVQDTKEIKFYGFKFSQALSWKEISADELQILRNLNRPIKRQYEPHSYESRGNKNVSDWIYSRL